MFQGVRVQEYYSIVFIIMGEFDRSNELDLCVGILERDKKIRVLSWMQWCKLNINVIFEILFMIYVFLLIFKM